MDIVVHGTKGGRKIFTPQKISGLLDVTADGAKATAIGQQAYSIRFTAGNTIFSKYKIIRDVRGDKRTGFVGFSLSIPNNKKLSGTEIITVLDKVSDEYSQTYIVDNNLNEVTENWAFLNSISNEYDTKLHPADDDENMQSGNKDDAFIYFKDTAKLQKYFDAPYQDEYTLYRQILFIDNALKDKPENPLNALRHSENDLTGKIDLENPKYKLLFNQNAKGGVRIEVKVNGSPRSNKNKIRRKNELQITWSKQYYKTKTQTGKWDAIGSEFLIVDDKEETVTIREIDLDPETKPIHFDVSTKKDNVKITNAEIQIDTQPWQQRAEYTFKAEELGREHKISARKGDNLFSDVEKITPKKFTDTSLTLQLIEKKVVKIVVTEAEGEENNVLDFKVWVSEGKCSTEKVSEITFTDEEIDKTYNITVEKDGFVRSEQKSYCPKIGENTIYFKLKKGDKTKNNMNYKVSAGKHGNLKDGNDYYSNNKSGSDVKDKIVPKKGYEFTAFELQGNTLIAQYRKKEPFYKQSKFFATVFVLLVLSGLGLVLWRLYSEKEKEKKKLLTDKQITAYVVDDSLFVEKLHEYKKQWEKRENDFIKSSGGIFGGEPDSSQWKKVWKPTYDSIALALKKRELINKKDFAGLRNLHYSKQQEQFKLAIEKIDSAKYEKVREKLGDNISDWTLTRIADSVTAVLNSKEKNANTKQSKEGKKEEKKVEQKKEDMDKLVENQAELPKSQKTNPVVSHVDSQNKTSEIIAYIRGNELKKQTLNQYLQDVGSNSTLKTSIKLCLEFWNLDGTKNNSYSSFQQKIREDKNLQNSELKDFVDKMCSKDCPKYLKEVPGNSAISTLTQLKNKLKNE
ncbi:MAG: hypothetical protein LBR36_04315 [Bacteroidales bacterium]|jgi:hypothetical protein|nr:hypothetical protein [Bacteroidales bacterium]